MFLFLNVSSLLKDYFFYCRSRTQVGGLNLTSILPVLYIVIAVYIYLGNASFVIFFLCKYNTMSLHKPSQPKGHMAIQSYEISIVYVVSHGLKHHCVHSQDEPSSMKIYSNISNKHVDEASTNLNITCNQGVQVYVNCQFPGSKSSD